LPEIALALLSANFAGTVVNKMVHSPELKVLQSRLFSTSGLCDRTLTYDVLQPQRRGHL
jgi:hypothetical protein